MRAYIILFYLALLATSWALSSNGPPQSVGVQIDDVQPSTKRKTYRANDSTFGDFFIVDQNKSTTFMDKVVNDAKNTTTNQSLPTLGGGH